ncbi:hypothetical protein GCM10009851_32650 [Herbiconiux moechotypicola]|uniref:Uncharacterized protein n=1 Tax=Herbiconiux moechotypicola TaxID=637393 RepID=A0ABN3DZ80_9MICO
MQWNPPHEYQSLARTAERGNAGTRRRSPGRAPMSAPGESMGACLPNPAPIRARAGAA